MGHKRTGAKVFVEVFLKNRWMNDGTAVERIGSGITGLEIQGQASPGEEAIDEVGPVLDALEQSFDGGGEVRGGDQRGVAGLAEAAPLAGAAPMQQDSVEHAAPMTGPQAHQCRHGQPGSVALSDPTSWPPQILRRTLAKGRAAGRCGSQKGITMSSLDFSSNELV